jgi:hypothetical protein
MEARPETRGTDPGRLHPSKEGSSMPALIMFSLCIQTVYTLYSCSYSIDRPKDHLTGRCHLHFPLCALSSPGIHTRQCTYRLNSQWLMMMMITLGAAIIPYVRHRNGIVCVNRPLLVFIRCVRKQGSRPPLVGCGSLPCPYDVGWRWVMFIRICHPGE